MEHPTPHEHDGSGQEAPSTAAPKILVVDDLAANIIAMKAILKKSGAEVVAAQSGREALRLALHHEFALILMDVQMPEMDGYETASLLRQYEGTERVPIIFVTALSKDDTYVTEGCQAGAVDYLFKPINAHLVLAKVLIFLEMYRLRQDLERAQAELAAVRAEHGGEGAPDRGEGAEPC